MSDAEIEKEWSEMKEIRLSLMRPDTLLMPD